MSKRVMHKPLVARLRLSVLLLLISVVLPLSCACQQASGKEDALVLNAIPLPTGLTYVSREITMEAGTFSVLVRPYGGSRADEQILVLSVGEDSLDTLLALSAPSGKVAGGGLPELMLDGKRILVKEVDWSPKVADFRERLQYDILDVESGEKLRVTPDNLTETDLWLCKGGPPCLWSDRHGLAMLIPEKKVRTVHLWQGTDSLTEVGAVEGVLGIGQGFVDGRLTAILVTLDGNAIAYDYRLGQLSKAPSLAPIARRLAETLGQPEKWPLSFALSKDFAGYKESVGKKNMFTIVPLHRPARSFERVDTFQRRPDGTQRSQKEVDALVEDRTPFAEEGSGLPADVISWGSVLIPIDGERLGILDLVYCRLILIEDN